MLGLPGYLEVTIVVVLLLLLFGGKRIPAVMRSIGQSITCTSSTASPAPDTSRCPLAKANG